MRATVITEETEVEEEPEVNADQQTPMVTALLRPRILELRAAYSRLSSRRDRLAFLRHDAVVGGAEAQIHGERLYVDRPRPLRRLRLGRQRRPPGIMGIRPSDRREDEVSVLAGVVSSGTVLLEPLPDGEADDEADVESSFLSELANIEEQDDRLDQPSRTLENWRGLTHSSTVTGTASPVDSSPTPTQSDPLNRRHGAVARKKP